jgi:Dolichyl-phosphate-mannose-protein mannosyltransferase
MLVEEKFASPTATPKQPDSAPPSSSAAPLRYVLWAAVAVAFTCFVLQYSLRYNRLAHYPTQDDITYISDGLDRLNIFYEQGVPGSFYFYKTVPPRAPVGTYMAALGFALFGYKDWAPYATNAVFVFILLWTIWVVMKGARLWAQIAAAVFVLCCPISLLLVNEFRPDLGCGLVTAFAIVTVLGSPFVSSPLRHKLAVGALFGAALFLKPSIFPGTVPFIVVAVTLAALRDMAVSGKRPDWRPALGAILLSLCTTAAVMLPYVRYAWKIMWDYIAVNVLNPEMRKTWEIPGGPSVQFRYYLDGPGGQFLLRGYLYLFLAVLVLGAVVILASRRRWAIYTALCMTLMLGLTYLAVSLAPGKNTLGGASFTWLLIFSCLMLFRSALESNRAWFPRIPWAAALLFFASLASLYGLHMPEKWSDPGDPGVQTMQRFVWDVFNTVMDKLDEAPLGKRRIFITEYGWINYQLLKYLAVREDRSPHEIPQVLPPDRADLKLFDQQIDHSELVLASEKGNGTIAEMMPAAALEDQSLALAMSRPDLVEIRRFATANGKQFHLFEKREAFAGWYRYEGFSRLLNAAPGGSFPESHLGYGPSSRIFFTRFEDGITGLHLRGKSLEPEEHVVLNIDGRRAAEFDLHGSDGLKDFSYEMSLAKGDHVAEFLYSDWQKGEDTRAVQFTEIQLLPRAAGGPLPKPRP